MRRVIFFWHFVLLKNPERLNHAPYVSSKMAIEAERHFFKVGREMLCADMMPSSHDAALQKRERGFDRVRVGVALDVDFHAYDESSCACPCLRRFLAALR